MKLYRLALVMHGPSEKNEDKDMAEILGRRARGDSAAEVLGNLQSVAWAFIESYRSRGVRLPPEGSSK